MGKRLVDAKLDSEFAADIEELADEYRRTVDPTNMFQVRDWLIKHSYLNAQDVACIAGRAYRKSYCWRKLFGINTGPARKAIPGVAEKCAIKVIRARTLEAPDDWDTQWLIVKYDEGYSTYELADAVSRSEMAIWTRLHRAGIVMRTSGFRPPHQCCNYNWLFEHYVVQRLTKSACAIKAGVSRYAISAWLTKFGIRMRHGAQGV